MCALVNEANAKYVGDGWKGLEISPRSTQMIRRGYSSTSTASICTFNFYLNRAGLPGTTPRSARPPCLTLREIRPRRRTPPPLLVAARAAAATASRCRRIGAPAPAPAVPPTAAAAVLLATAAALAAAADPLRQAAASTGSLVLCGAWCRPGPSPPAAPPLPMRTWAARTASCTTTCAAAGQWRASPTTTGTGSPWRRTRRRRCSRAWRRWRWKTRTTTRCAPTPRKPNSDDATPDVFRRPKFCHPLASVDTDEPT